MKRYILDASVILTFLLKSNSSVEKNFVKILKEVNTKKAKLYSSYLLPLEIGNGLRFTLKNELVSEEVLQKFLRLPIKYFIFSAAHYAKILELSYLFKTSFYDTSYHFLAKLLKGTFLTCDTKYFKKAKDFGNIKNFGF